MKMYFLDRKNLDLAFHIRREVFIKEQNIDENIEIDGSDEYAKNMILELDNVPVATSRLIKIENKIYIGRVCVLKEYRKKGYAKNMINFLLDNAKDMGYKEVFIHSQAYLKDFYKNIGFVQFGDEFLEAGIVHIHMKIDI